MANATGLHKLAMLELMMIPVLTHRDRRSPSAGWETMPSFLRWQIPMNPDETSFSMMMMTVAAESADTAASIDRRMILTKSKIKTDLLRWNNIPHSTQTEQGH